MRVKSYENKKIFILDKTFYDEALCVLRILITKHKRCLFRTITREYTISYKKFFAHLKFYGSTQVAKHYAIID
jgi:hypothetical protein